MAKAHHHALWFHVRRVKVTHPPVMYFYYSSTGTLHALVNTSAAPVAEVGLHNQRHTAHPLPHTPNKLSYSTPYRS